VCLVQGPPGTGKSSTIVGIILQILYSKLGNNNTNQLPRILVVAPSNAAVDELAMRLIQLKSQLQVKYTLVRLGILESIHHQVRSHSYDSIIKQAFEAERRNVENMEQEERSLRSSAQKIFLGKLKAEADGNKVLVEKLTRDHIIKMNEVAKLKALKKSFLDSPSMKEKERIAMEKAMDKVDIILATLSSSTNAQMEKSFMKTSAKNTSFYRPISVCVLDEASQCVEPEALIPLKLGFCKLVMVGDHEQLPATVTSRLAQQYNFKQSLFGRLYSYFTGSIDSAVHPVLKLLTQYRMHKEIAFWPSKYFYGGSLQQGCKDRETDLPPYTVINVSSNESHKAEQCWNVLEEKVVIELIKILKAKVSEMSIGVITYYGRQKRNIMNIVSNKKLSNVAVNTVDGFQGSERDIIIISCVRGGSSNIGFVQDRQRLNVALTRAKYCLVVVGNMTTLKNANSMWNEFVSNAKKRNMLYDLSTAEGGKVDYSHLKSIIER